MFVSILVFRVLKNGVILFMTVQLKFKLLNINHALEKSSLSCGRNMLIVSMPTYFWPS